MFGSGEGHARQRADPEDARRPPGAGASAIARSWPPRRRRSTPTASSSTSRRARRSAPRRCAGSATSRWTWPTTRASTGTRGARLQGGDRPLQRLPQGLSERPRQRPRPLPAGPRLRAGRRPEHGAEDARPAGQGLPAQPLPRRGPVPPRRAAVHRQGLCRTPRRRSPPCSPAARPSRTTTARSTCRAGRSSSRCASRTACARSSPCSTSRSPARRAKAASRPSPA